MSYVIIPFLAFLHACYGDQNKQLQSWLLSFMWLVWTFGIVAFGPDGGHN